MTGMNVVAPVAASRALRETIDQVNESFRTVVETVADDAATAAAAAESVSAASGPLMEARDQAVAAAQAADAVATSVVELSSTLEPTEGQGVTLRGPFNLEGDGDFDGIRGADDKLVIGVEKATGATVLKPHQRTVDHMTQRMTMDFVGADESSVVGVRGEDDRFILGVDKFTGEASFKLNQASRRYVARHVSPRDQPIYHPERLRQTHRCISQIRNGDGGAFSTTWIGDSWIGGGSNFGTRFATRIQTEFGNAGSGYVSFYGNPVFSSSITVTKEGSWVTNTPSTAIAASPDLFLATSSTPGDKYTVVNARGDTAATILARSGTVRYRFDGGSWVELAFTGDAVQSAALTGVPNSPGTSWTLEIEVVSGTVKLIGLNLSLSSTAGIRYNLVGKGGTDSQDWVAPDEASFVAGHAALGSNLTVFMTGVNEQWAGTAPNLTPDQTYANCLTLIDRLRLARPSQDILLVTSPTVREGRGPHMDLYSEAMREAAAVKLVAHLDLGPFFGEALADYEYGSSRQLLDDSLIHPSSPQGPAVIADAIYRTLFLAA